MALNRNLVRASRDILRGNLELLEVLGSAIAKRDSDTNTHNYRVTWYTLRLEEEVGASVTEIRRLIAGKCTLTHRERWSFVVTLWRFVISTARFTSRLNSLLWLMTASNTRSR